MVILKTVLNSKLFLGFVHLLLMISINYAGDISLLAHSHACSNHQPFLPFCLTLADVLLVVEVEAGVTVTDVAVQAVFTLSMTANVPAQSALICLCFKEGELHITLMDQHHNGSLLTEFSENANIES